jgi:UDP-glucose 4-epimerase
VWNLGTGSGYSVRELINITQEVTGKHVPTTITPRRAIDLAIPVSNPEKAEKELFWKAKRTLKESVANAYKFLSRFRERDTE